MYRLQTWSYNSILESALEYVSESEGESWLQLPMHWQSSVNILSGPTYMDNSIGCCGSTRGANMHQSLCNAEYLFFVYPCQHLRIVQKRHIVCAPGIFHFLTTSPVLGAPDANRHWKFWCLALSRLSRTTRLTASRLSVATGGCFTFNSFTCITYPRSHTYNCLVDGKLGTKGRIFTFKQQKVWNDLK